MYDTRLQPAIYHHARYIRDCVSRALDQCESSIDDYVALEYVRAQLARIDNEAKRLVDALRHHAIPKHRS